MPISIEAASWRSTFRKTPASMDPHSLRVLFVSSEATPFAKTGGLADVAGALPLELARLGHQVWLVIPRYGTIDGAAHGFKEWKRVTVPTSSGPIEAIIEQGVLFCSQGPPDCQVSVLAIRYDDLTAHPEAVAAAVMRYCRLPVADGARLRDIFARDAQEGTSLARDDAAQGNQLRLTVEEREAVVRIVRRHPVIATPDVVVPGTLRL